MTRIWKEEKDKQDIEPGESRTVFYPITGKIDFNRKRLTPLEEAKLSLWTYKII